MTKSCALCGEEEIEVNERCLCDYCSSLERFSQEVCNEETPIMQPDAYDKKKDSQTKI